MNDNIKLRSDMNNLQTEYERVKQIMSNLELGAEKDAAAIKKLTTRLSQAQEDTAKLANRNKVLEQELSDKERYIERIQGNCDKFCNENSQLKRLQDDVVKENVDLLEVNRNLKSQLNEVQGSNQQLNDELELLKSNLDLASLDNEEQKKLNEDIKQQFNKALDDNRRLESERELECEQLKAKLQSELEEKDHLRLEIMKLQHENAKLKVW